MTPLDAFKKIKWFLRGPIAHRDICCHEIHQKGSKVNQWPLSMHSTQPNESLWVLGPLATCDFMKCIERGERLTYDSFNAFKPTKSIPRVPRAPGDMCCHQMYQNLWPLLTHLKQPNRSLWIYVVVKWIKNLWLLLMQFSQPNWSQEALGSDLVGWNASKGVIG